VNVSDVGRSDEVEPVIQGSRLEMGIDTAYLSTSIEVGWDSYRKFLDEQL
jgi:hypothetical protein